MEQVIRDTIFWLGTTTAIVIAVLVVERLVS
jgi:hypothetical protein